MHKQATVNEKLIRDLRIKVNQYEQSTPYVPSDDNQAFFPNNFFNDDNMADANDALVRQLGELFSREDKKSIPIFKRSSDEKLVTDWLREAERIANNNEWDDEQKLKFFPDRFKHEAADWHAS